MRQGASGCACRRQLLTALAQLTQHPQAPSAQLVLLPDRRWGAIAAPKVVKQGVPAAGRSDALRLREAKRRQQAAAAARCKGRLCSRATAPSPSLRQLGSNGQAHRVPAAAGDGLQTLPPRLHCGASYGGAGSLLITAEVPSNSANRRYKLPSCRRICRRFSWRAFGAQAAAIDSALAADRFRRCVLVVAPSTPLRSVSSALRA